LNLTKTVKKAPINVGLERVGHVTTDDAKVINPKPSPTTLLPDPDPPPLIML
jgi:hypothetical protein